MTIEKDGGPAFPMLDAVSIHNRAADAPEGIADADELERVYNIERTKAASGMSLRDYFAAKAMQAFLSGHIAHHGHESHWPYDQMVFEAYDVADAMLKQRENPQE